MSRTYLFAHFLALPFVFAPYGVLMLVEGKNPGTFNIVVCSICFLITFVVFMSSLLKNK